jgi:hypothetical protein
LTRRKVKIVELHERQVLTAVDPGGILIEIWQAETERFEIIVGPDVTGRSGPVEIALFDTPLLRSARTGATKTLENLRMWVDDEPDDREFVQFLKTQANFRCGSYVIKIKDEPTHFQCSVCQAPLPAERGERHRFEIDLKPLDVPTFYLRIDATAALCSRCGRHMLLWSDEANAHLETALADALSRLTAAVESS